MPDHGRATLQQVADLAGVSLATASRAINGSPNRKVNAELVERVRSAAVELDYTVNQQAKAMVLGRTNVIGLVVGDIVDPYFSSIASGVIRAAAESGLLVNLAATERDPVTERELLAMFSAQLAQAVVLVGSRHTDEGVNEQLSAQIAAVEARGGRVVSVGQPLAHGDAVVVNNGPSAASLASALLDLGHRKFAVLSGPPELCTPQERTSAFIETLAQAGCPAPVVIPSAFTRDGGHQAMSALLADRADVTCVWAVADAMAMGALTACRERGVRVPDDYSVAGFDDIPLLSDVHPRLTSVHLPLADIGREALRLALEPRGQEPRRVVMGGEVVLRASTAAV